MDGKTLQALAVSQPRLKFVVPAASAELAMQRIGVGPDRLLAVDAGESHGIDGVAIEVMRAAHETLERDEHGRHRFLGHGLTVGYRKIFHSGDTVPFEGHAEEIRHFAPDLALFPVNGRSETLAQAGFAGNFTLAEAITLAERCGIGAMIAHHYGMFAFNTIPPDAIDAASVRALVQILRAKLQVEFRIDAM